MNGPIIGEGAYGQVRVCEINGQKMAVKSISKKACSQEVLEKFLPRELETVVELKHENIVNVFEVFETKKNFNIIMELVEGGDLLDKVNESAMSEEEAKRIFKQIVAAVKYCHDKNIAHRDIKLENILLDLEGNVKLADFGFCKSVKENELSNTFCGSASYTAPEILAGESYDAFKADMWSLGVMLYAMVFGVLPFGKIAFPESEVSEECQELIKSLLAPASERASLSEVVESKWF